MTNFDFPWIDDLRSYKKSETKRFQTPNMAPSFYTSDMDKWHQKFQKVNSERKRFKQTKLRDKEMSPSTLNPNTKNSKSEYIQKI